MSENNDRLRAIINDAKRSDVLRDAALVAEQQYRPAQWTPAMEAELVERLHGTDAERLDALIAENNERIRKS